MSRSVARKAEPWPCMTTNVDVGARGHDTDCEVIAKSIPVRDALLFPSRFIISMYGDNRLLLSYSLIYPNNAVIIGASERLSAS